MKRRKKLLIFQKLNKSTAIKAFITALVIILIEVCVGILVYNSYYNHVFGEAYAEQERAVAAVTDDIASSLGDGVLPEAGSAALDTAVEKLADSGFDYYGVFVEASGGRVVGGNFGTATLTEFGVTNLKSGAIVGHGGGHYIFVSRQFASSHLYIGGVSDYSEEYQIINSMLDNLVALLVIAGVLTLCAFVFYAYWAGGKTRYGRFDYKFTVSGDGKVLHSNAKLKHDYGELKEIRTDFAVLDKNRYNLMKLRSPEEGDKLLISRHTVKKGGEQFRVVASNINNADKIVSILDDGEEELTASGKAKTSLSRIFTDFSKRGKRTLLGLIFITNLNQISALFGKDMALAIQKAVIKKIKDKFQYVYELDFAQIGVICPDGKKLDIILSEIEDVLHYISQPIKMEDNLFTVEMKSGFAICDDTMQNLTFEYAMKAAEAARQRAIDTKIADYIVYHESQKKLYAKYFITYDIKQMLTEGAFEMEYQPQYNIKENRIEGFEALFRVKKSWNVNVDTFSFITYAERTGAMVQLGDFMFDTGMRFAKQLEGKNVSISLNVSPVQLMQAGFTENFLRLYKKYDLKPGSICVEITESFLMTNFRETLAKLEILKSNGIHTHLDDFGTEYSSLLYIKKLPISTIKIDKEFVRDVLKSKESQAVIRFITNIAKLLNLTTICEGVENPQEYDMLAALGCDTIQGWIIGKSMKPEDALAIVDTFSYKEAAAKKQAQQAASSGAK